MVVGGMVIDGKRPTPPEASAAASQRQLRRRDAPKAPYRPRPALTSSARGRSNAEARRERELAANAAFVKANALAETTLLATRNRKSTTPSSSTLNDNTQEAEGTGRRAVRRNALRDQTRERQQEQADSSSQQLVSSHCSSEQAINNSHADGESAPVDRRIMSPSPASSPLASHSDLVSHPHSPAPLEQLQGSTASQLEVEATTTSTTALVTAQGECISTGVMSSEGRPGTGPRGGAQPQATDHGPRQNKGYDLDQPDPISHADVRESDDGNRLDEGPLSRQGTHSSKETQTTIPNHMAQTPSDGLAESGKKIAEPSKSTELSPAAQEEHRFSEEQVLQDLEMADATLVYDGEHNESAPSDHTAVQIDAGDDTLVDAEPQQEASLRRNSELVEKLLDKVLDDGVSRKQCDSMTGIATLPNLGSREKVVDENEARLQSGAGQEPEGPNGMSIDTEQIEPRAEAAGALERTEIDKNRRQAMLPETSGQSTKTSKRGNESLSSPKPPSKAARISFSDEEFDDDDDFLEQLADHELDLDSHLVQRATPDITQTSHAWNEGDCESSPPQQKPPPTDGFVWGRGQAAKKPNAEALRRWEKLIDDSGEVNTRLAAESASQRPPQSQQHPSTPIPHRTLLPSNPRPSEPIEVAESSSRLPLTPLQSNTPAAPQHEPTEEVPAVLSLDKRAHDDDEVQVPRPPAQRPSSASEPASFATPASKAIMFSQSPGASRASLDRGKAPARLGTRGRFSTPMTTSQASKTVAQTIGGRTNSTPTRLSFASTPRRPSGFKTPFKDGVTPARASEMSSPSRLAATNRFAVPLANSRPHASIVDDSGANRVGSSSQARPAHIGLPDYRPVFALHCNEPRKSMREYPLSPEDKDLSAWMRDANSPEEFKMILNGQDDPARFHFEDLGAPKGQKALCKMLDSLGTVEVGKRWVDNHYRLILWKLAALVRSSPDEGWRFSWMEVCRQMKYR